MDNRCFALNRNNRCEILTARKCCGNACSFYKTPEQVMESCKKANARLASLDKEYQKYIADTWYHGKMPWLKGGAVCDN